MTVKKLKADSVDLLKQFASPTEIGVASFHAFGKRRCVFVPTWILQSIEKGFLEVSTLDQNKSSVVVDDQTFENRILVLTDAGRAELGLPPLKEKKEKTLFDL